MMDKKSSYKILVIDDEPDMTRAIRLTINVQEPDWQVIESNSGDEGLNLLDRENPDLVLLDIRMPDMDGFEVLQRIRSFSTVPVIILTVRDDELDEVKALEGGADDYIVKPFGHLELLAHIRAVLRRVNGLPLEYREPIVIGKLRIDFNNHSVSINGREIALTTTEFALLEILSSNINQVIPFEILLARVWGHNAVDNREYLKVYIRKLRMKLEDDPSFPRYIVTVKGVGYKLVSS